MCCFLRRIIPLESLDLMADLRGLPEHTNRRQLEEYRRFLHRAIATQLTQRQRQILCLYYFDGCSMPEIAQQLGIHKSSVSRTIRTALDRLTSLSQVYFQVHS